MTNTHHLGSALRRYQLPITEGELYFMEDFCPLTDSWLYLEQLIEEIPWQQHQVKIFGKTHNTPRLTAFQGDPAISYCYSGLAHHARPWHPTVRLLKNQIEQWLDHTFNCVLINYYRNGQDSMGWHSDDESSLGTRPLIASLTLGTSRQFQLRKKQSTHAAAKGNRFQLVLNSGSLLVMAGHFQQHWQHAVHKSKTIHEPRINLTFRWVNTNGLDDDK